MLLTRTPAYRETASRHLREVVNVAHRGASAYAPENTLAAVRKAIARDCDLVEVDVQRSKDGALVLLHDTTLARTTDVRRLFPRRAPWFVGDFTLAEIQSLDAGSWKSPTYAGETIPTLEEAIDVLRLSRAGLQLEVKAVSLHPGVVRDVVSALCAIPGYVSSATAAKRLVVQSFDHEAMHEHKTLEPSICVGLLGAPARARLPGLTAWADQINPGHPSITASYVSAVHELGMECLVWTVNRASSMNRVLDMGVDGVITNHPDVLDDVLSRRAIAHPDAATHQSAARVTL